MSDNTQHPDNNEQAAIPESGTEPTVALDAATTAAPATTAPATRRSRTPLLIAGGVVGALLLLGGGTAIGAAIASDADSHHSGSHSGHHGGPGGVRDDDERDGDHRDGDDHGGAGWDDDDRDEQRGQDSDDGPRGDGGAGISSSSGWGSADEVVDALALAAREAPGKAVEIKFAANGGTRAEFYDASSRTKTEVLLPTGGGAASISSETEDSTPTAFLDPSTVQKAVTAALADTAGRVIQIDVDESDSGLVSYDVDIVTSAGQVVEVTLDAKFSVVATSRD